jgi:hypothetical protein
MTVAIDGHSGIPLRHLSHVDARLGYSTAAGENAPRQDSIGIRGQREQHVFP